jgi:putative transposase
MGNLIGQVTKEKVFLPYWNSSVEEKSKNLWLPIKLESQDLDSNLTDSWYSTRFISPLKQNYIVSPVEFATSENSLVRSKKIRIYPSEEQKSILNSWFGCARYVFNKTIEYLKQPDTKANWKEIKGGILATLPDWAKGIPYQIKSIAIRDACQAVSNAKKKFKVTGKFQEVKFRAKKKRRHNIFIPQNAVINGSVYHTLLGKLFSTESVGVTEYDCRLVFQYGRYFLSKPEKRSILKPDNQRFKMVSLDPGVRTFQTFFSPELAGKFGSYDFGRIHRLCFYLDDLISKMSKVKSKRKRRLRKASDRLRWKIKDLISEIHFKTANFLCKFYEIIILPPFETSQMVSKLRSKTVRAMLTWSHFRFSEILKNKAEEYSSVLLRQCEAYTSKTCSNCGKIHNIGSKEFLKCTCCVLDRDLNGARGIFLRALVDQPLLANY